MTYSKTFELLGVAARARVQEVTAEEVDALLSAGAVVVDVRDREEFDLDHIAGAVHVSRGTLEMRIESVIPDLNATVLCYCNANHRGALSADALRAMGYKNARLIAGGLRAYRQHTPNARAADSSASGAR